MPTLALVIGRRALPFVVVMQALELGHWLTVALGLVLLCAPYRWLDPRQAVRDKLDAEPDAWLTADEYALIRKR